MTTGNRVHGFLTTMPSSRGNLPAKIGYGTRVWNGVDYPKAPPVYEIYTYDASPREVLVRRGKGYEVITLPPRMRFRRVRPPKRGRVEEHPYSMSDSTYTDCVFAYRNPPPFPNTWYEDTGTSSGFFSPVYKQTWSSDDDIRLFGKLREKVAGSDFNAGVFLGEGHEALAMIANSATRIRKAYDAARKGNLVGAHHFLTNGLSATKLKTRRKAYANNWLELQYGWLPLLNDAKNGAEFLSHHLSVPLQNVVRASVYRAGTVSNSWAADTTSVDGICYTRKSIKALIRERDVAALAGLQDPLSVAWELLPYSFVIDWFIPIGNYLSARGLTQSLSGTFVTSTKVFGEARNLHYRNASQYVFDGRQAGLYSSKVSFSRSVSSSLSVPLPSMKPLSSVPTWKHCANALALLSQLKR